ncbi:MAG: protoheme IX farnesyltransferase, partial [Actinobacteria bacterium]|nr:protoheme IX farnesyltransferase [Actinomycetota bacterium]
MAVGARPLVPSRLARRALSHNGSGRRPTTVIGGYIALTKPRIVELLLVTTVPTMVLAQKGWPATWLVVLTLVGGSLAAGGAQGRPLVTGLIAPRNAVIFAWILEIVAFAILWVSANLLSALLTFSATMFYVVIYSVWLKRTSRQNIVIGGAAGAVPVLVGWSAVTNQVSWAAFLLFLLIFLWTPPHFWALAIRHSDDYKAAQVPMLPTVVPMKQTLRAMLRYTVALVVASLVLVPVGHLGAIYGVSAAVLGVLFLLGIGFLWRTPTEAVSMRVFSYSISYISLLFGAITV